MDRGERSSVEARILTSNERSLDYLRAIREHPGDRGVVFDSIRQFVLHRFFLVEENPSTEDIVELSRLSIEKLLEVNRAGMLQDVSNNCAGVSSETTKKALLIMMIQKQLGIVIPAEENDTLSQIAVVVVRLLA